MTCGQAFADDTARPAPGPVPQSRPQTSTEVPTKYDAIQTVYHVILPSAERRTHEIDWPVTPSYELIAALVEPLLGDGEELEHVSVLYQNRPADMFVSETGAQRWRGREPLPINEEATAIYRAYWLKRNPGANPKLLPAIHGPAILFERIVWR